MQYTHVKHNHNCHKIIQRLIVTTLKKINIEDKRKKIKRSAEEDVYGWNNESSEGEIDSDQPPV